MRHFFAGCVAVVAIADPSAVPAATDDPLKLAEVVVTPSRFGVAETPVTAAATGSPRAGRPDGNCRGLVSGRRHRTGDWSRAVAADRGERAGEGETPGGFAAGRNRGAARWGFALQAQAVHAQS